MKSRLRPVPAGKAVVARQYSASGGTITEVYTFNTYTLFFPFQVSDRYVTVTPLRADTALYPPEILSYTVQEDCCGPNTIRVIFSRWDPEFLEWVTPVTNSFHIVVY